MISFCSKTIMSIARKNVLYSSYRYATKVTMGDPLEHATGIEKRELLAKISGNDDPFDFKPIKRGPGTRDCPNEIPSAFSKRLIGCICEDDCMTISYMWLYKGEPKRCECGHWFVLVHKAPV